MDMFKFKITLDRHNGIQNLNYYDLPDPPRFSLPSTFNSFGSCTPPASLLSLQTRILLSLFSFGSCTPPASLLSLSDSDPPLLNSFGSCTPPASLLSL
jgi:hypothetical protein